MVKLTLIDIVDIGEHISFKEYESMEYMENAFKNKDMRLGALGDYDLIGIQIDNQSYDINRINLFDWLYTRVKR